jgi:hypothetical protein
MKRFVYIMLKWAFSAREVLRGRAGDRLLFKQNSGNPTDSIQRTWGAGRKTQLPHGRVYWQSSCAKGDSCGTTTCRRRHALNNPTNPVSESASVD